MTAFHGQMGMFTRALSYILSHGADGLRQVAEDAVLNANYRAAQPRGRARRAVRGERAVHARGPVQRQGLRRRPHHARSRQGADRRGLSPDDHVFPAGRPRRDAGRADRDREQGGARPVHRRAAQRRRAGARPATRASRPRRSSRRAAGSTRRWRRASRSWSTRSRRRREAARSDRSTPLGAACRAQCRADRRGAARRAARARAGARSGERDRRACRSISRGNFPKLLWQPSDPEPAAVRSIEAWRAEAGLFNLLPAISLDARAAEWPVAAGRRDPVHQHGPYQPLGGDRRADARRGAAARRRARRSISTAPIARPGSRPRRATRRSTRACGRAIRTGACATSTTWSPKRRRTGFGLESVIEMPANNLSVIFRKG